MATIFRTAKRASRTRAIVAAAHTIDLHNRAEARKQRALRAPWQRDAFVYRNSIGELRYGINFLANSAARMKVYVAARSVDGESNLPLPITDPAIGAPPEVIEAARLATLLFTNGTNDMSDHMRIASTNISLAGEAYILGQDDPETGSTTYSIRSVSEIAVFGDTIMLREGPVASMGRDGMIELDPDLTDLSRIWQVDPEYRARADSSVRAIINECESLLILRRSIRAVGRSRYAGAGILLVPDELGFAEDVDGDGVESDPFLSTLTRNMMTPIADEGSASEVVPLVIRGSADALKEFRYLDIARSFDEWAIKIRQEIVGVIASGLDLPKEVIMGVADLNHWSAWQVDDNTFRHHIEPHVIVLMQCFTDGFLKAAMTAMLPISLQQQWLPRLTFWYDPTELVTHPDQTQNALNAHDRLAISDAALRRYLGLSEGDAPTSGEVEIRMIRNVRTLPPNLLMALYHELDPTLAVPAITQSGVIPGVKPGLGGGAIMPTLPPALAEPGAPAAAAPAETATVTPTPPLDTGTAGPPAISDQSATSAARELVAVLDAGEREALQRAVLGELRSRGYRVTVPAITAASKPSTSASKRLSKQLTGIDRDLRARVQAAANAAVVRQLEKAGVRLNQKVAKNARLRALAASVHVEFIPARIGQAEAERLGIVASDLMRTEWDTLEATFRAMVDQAQRNAIKVAAQLASVDETTAWAAADVAMGQGVDNGWDVLRRALDSISMSALYNPHPNVSVADMAAALNPDALVPTGVVRCALAVAGGAKEQDFGIVKTITGAEVPAVSLGNPVGGVATGATVSDVLTNFGASTAGYEWVHGPSAKPFEPHEALDGVEFSHFDDPALANPGDFPSNLFLFPGDHDGCLCDVTPLWVSDQDVASAMGNG